MEFLIVDFGMMQIYEIINFTDTGSITRGFYWRDLHSPQGYGPFPHIILALRHWKEVANGSNLPKIENKNAPGEVINVDFSGKKRV